jgi:predicted CoA-binding protein
MYFCADVKVSTDCIPTLNNAFQMEKTTKTTVIIGASPKSDRYSFMATERLTNHGHPVFPIGIKTGQIGQKAIITDRPPIDNVDTVTLYLNPTNQEDWKEYILSLQPKRVIFNPGTENPEFENELSQQNIEAIEACTLVLLSTGLY